MLNKVLIGAALALLPVCAFAQTVTLRAEATRFEVTGELQSFDGDIWVLRTNIGEIRMPGLGVVCIAGDCPNADGSAVAEAPVESTPDAVPEVVVAEIDPTPIAEPTVSDATSEVISDATSDATGPELSAEPDLDVAIAETPEVTLPAEVAQVPATLETPAVAQPEIQLSAPVIADTRSFDENRIRLAGLPFFTRDLAPLMIETWGFLGQRDFAQSGPANARVLLLSGGGLDPLDVELISADIADIAELMDQSFVDIALAGEEILAEMPNVDYAVIGLDAAALITTRDNQVNALSINDLAGILSGEISNWQALGGPDLPIRLFLPGDETSTAAIIADQILAGAGLVVSPNAQQIESEALLADSVARERGAIGIVGFAAVRNAKPLAISDSCGLRSAPDEFSIKAGDYPLVRRILAVYPAGGTSNSTASLIEFMTGTMAERTMVNAGLVAMAPATASVAEQGLRFAQVTLDPSTRGAEMQLIEFTQTLIDARRLSLTLRAGDLESGLDSRGEDDLHRLATLISANRFSGQEIVLVGFSDSARASAESLALSQDRAAVAAAALLAQIGTLPAGVAITSIGFGHVAPLACNADPRGAIANNRIEVWARALN